MLKIRGLLIAAFIFFVLAGILYWSEHRKPEANAKAPADTPPPILKLDESSITNLEIKKKDAPPVQVAKLESGTWQITQPKAYSADQNAVSGIVSSLSSLNSERVVDEKAVDLNTYGLAQPTLEIDIGQKDKTQKLLVGDDTPTGGSVYAMLAGNPRVYTMSSYGKNSLDKSLNDLRDKRLLTVNPDKISRMELIRKNQAIEFGRDKDEWQILKPKALRADSSLVDEAVRKLTDARMDLSGSDDHAAASAFAKATPAVKAKLTDQSGTQELDIRKGKDTYYAKSSVVEGTYKIGSDVAQSIDKGVEDFRNKKIFDFGFNDPSKIEVHNGSKAYFLARNGDDWWSNGKKMDADSVQTLVARLRDLTASRFPDSGFSSASIEVTVISNDGKRTEKVAIARSGNGYLAKREDDPVLYQLDSNAVDEMLKAADDVKAPAPLPK